MEARITKKVEEFFSTYQPHTYAKGKIVLLSGDKVEHIYYLTRGRVKVYDVSHRGDEVILNMFKPMAFFPMAPVLNDRRNPYIYEAETEIELRKAPASAVVTFLKENPDVLLDLLRRVYSGVDGLMERMSHLMSSDARSRIAFELMLECRRFGKHVGDDVYVIAINERQLGSQAGLTRETVSREISRLKKEGCISVAPGDMLKIDTKALNNSLSQFS